jgi:hypothetical protein
MRDPTVPVATRATRQILGLDPGAIRAVFVGVVDEVTVGG